MSKSGLNQLISPGDLISDKYLNRRTESYFSPSARSLDAFVYILENS